MSISGTQSYAGADVPALVSAAVGLAAQLLQPGGAVVIDDFTPMTEWPPRHDGSVDQARLDWLSHAELLAAEVRLAPDLSSIVATRRP